MSYHDNGSLLRDDYHTIDIITRHCFEPWLSQGYGASLTASTAVVQPMHHRKSAVRVH